MKLLDGKDEAGDRAHEESVKELKAKEAEGKVVVDMTEPDDEEETTPEKDGPSREEKKKNRYRERVAEARAEKERADRLEQENRAFRDMMSEQTNISREMLHTIKRSQPQQDDPLNAEYKGLQKKRDELNREYQSLYQSSKGQLSPDVYQSYQQRYVALEDDMRITAGRIGARDAMPRQDPQREAAMKAELFIRARHPDVTSHPQADQYAQNIYKAYVSAGEPVGWETLDKAMEDTRKRFRMTSSRGAPSSDLKRKFASSPNGGTRSNEEPDSEELDRDEMNMARTFYKSNPRAKDWDDKTLARHFIRDVKRA
jgi:hypothetical protein